MQKLTMAAQCLNLFAMGTKIKNRLIWAWPRILTAGLDAHWPPKKIMGGEGQKIRCLTAPTLQDKDGEIVKGL